jgi:DNA-binding NtrC family response regulator
VQSWQTELAAATGDYERGRFSAVVQRLRPLAHQGQECRILLAEALELTGEWDSAFTITRELSERRSLEPRIRGRALVVRAAIQALRGHVHSALKEFADAIECLAQTNAPELMCEARLRELSCLSDLRIETRLAELAETVREEVVRLGSRRLLALYHVAAANYCAATDQLTTAEMHVALARSHLRIVNNVWLEASLSLAESGISFLRSDLQKAIDCARKAAQSAAASGHRWCSAAASTNLAFLLTRTGRVADARRHLETSQKLSQGMPAAEIGALDNAAQLALLEYDTQGVERLASQTETLDAALVETSWYRLALTQTRARLARVLGQWDKICELSTSGAALARRRHAKSFECLFLAYEAEARCRQGNTAGAATLLRQGFTLLDTPPLSVAAELHRVLAVLLASQEKPSVASESLAKASRIAELIGDAVVSSEILATAKELNLPPSHRPDRAEPELLLLSLLTVASEPDQLLDGVNRLGINAGLLAAEIETTVRLEPKTNRTERLPPDVVVGRAQDDVTTQLGLTPSNDVLDVLRIAGLEKLTRAALVYGARSGERAPEPTEAGDGELFGSKNMRQVLDVATRIAPTKIPILITGETGSGKEVLGRLIHKASGRASLPFVTVNCSAIPRELLESQLFGHRKGAFTGATESFPGVVKSAAHGTLFLDEIGDLPIELQPKLLRFLETGEIQPLGAAECEEVNVRIIAATHADLPALVQNGRFRGDLYYRVNGVHLAIPPLRSRREEIPGLVRTFLQRYASEFQKETLKLTTEALEQLLVYPWPGNIRQLSAELRRAAALAPEDGTIPSTLFSSEISGLGAAPPPAPTREEAVAISLDQRLSHAVSTVESALIMRALAKSSGRMEDAAKLLGISRKGLFLKRRRYGISGTQES